MKNRALKNPQLTKNLHNKPNEPIPTKKPPQQSVPEGK